MPDHHHSLALCTAVPDLFTLFSDLIDLTVDESEPWQLQPQFTSIPPQMTMVSSVYDPSAVQAQFTAFDPYAQQAQYEAMLQAEYARQQAEAAQQQQYYALQMQATQFQAAQFQPVVPQKTAVHGCVLPLCPVHRSTDVACHQLKQPLRPSTLPATHTRTHVHLLAATERIRNSCSRAGPRTPTLKCLRLVTRVFAAPAHPHLLSCGRAGRRS